MSCNDDDNDDLKTTKSFFSERAKPKSKNKFFIVISIENDRFGTQSTHTDSDFIQDK